MSDVWQRLQEPFPAVEVEWRIQRAGESNNGPWGEAVPYVTTGAIIRRLDKVLGPENWKDEYKSWHSIQDRDKDGRPTELIIPSQLCGLSVKVGSEWITKWDGAASTDIESIKGGLSDSFKRAACKWGIGLYLRNCHPDWVKIVDRSHPGATYNRSYIKSTNSYVEFHWLPPQLPDWALPKGEKPAPEPPRQVHQAPPAVQHSAAMGNIDQKKLDEAILVAQNVNDVNTMKMIGNAAKQAHEATGDPNEATMNCILDVYRNRLRELMATKTQG